MNFITFMNQFDGMSIDEIIKVCAKIKLTKEESKVYDKFIEAIDDGNELTSYEQNRVMQRVIGYLLVTYPNQLNGQNNRIK